MIHSVIISTLQPTGVPVRLRSYDGTATQYITFFTEEYPELVADDSEAITGFFVQLEVFSKGNYNDLVDQVAELMKDAGFEKMSFRDDPYSKENSMFHKVMTFSYIQGGI